MSRKNVKKVPVVMQMETVECGAAALSMLLAYHGKWLSIEQLRTDCGVSRDGSNARNIVLAARHHGMDAHGWQADIDHLPSLAPAIIHWNHNHFVVFKGFHRGMAFINDPAIGSMAVSMKDFQRSYTGVAITSVPGDDFKPQGHQTSILHYVRENIRGAKDAFIFTLLMGILMSFAGMVYPLFSQVFLDSIITGKNDEWTVPFFVGIACLVVFNFLLALLDNVYGRRFAGSMSLKGNTRFLWHALNLPIEFFTQRYVGDIVQRQSLNEHITTTLIRILAPYAVNVALLVLYIVVMAQYSVLLTIVGISVVALNIYSLAAERELRTNLARALEQSEGKFYGITMSCVDNIESIKAAGAERGFFEFWAGTFARRNNQEVAFQKRPFWPFVFGHFANSFILILGAALILNGQFSIGMLMAFQGFMAEFMKPAMGLMQGSTTVLEMRSQMERIDDVMAYPAEQTGKGESPAHNAKLGGMIEMKNVSFGYSLSAAPLIRDFSMTLHPGKSVAIVGASGCGKSTIAKLLTGLYQPWSGEILFDGRDSHDISRDEFVNSVACIDQNVVLFDDTIAENIKMWDHSIEDFTMTMACIDAGIRDDIISRPRGFNTRLVKGGGNFSGGQRQRFEIATALAREPVILILDEATSALDTVMESEVMQSIRQCGASTIVIAHRLSTIRDCDEIIVMDKGRIVQRGTHDELMAQGGRYEELIRN
ncbi:MAG: cysteine peptidase family C39 domain-containing protein [Prevotella sp.]|nr:cysteine peptidase family C39 domain-containing protein [Prevotella sp.]